MALEGAQALVAGLPRVYADPAAAEGRESCLYGAYLVGLALAGAGSGLHHKICHLLGGAYNLPHAELHATVLPHVLAFNAPAVPELSRRLTVALRPAAASAAVAASAASGAAVGEVTVGEPPSVALSEMYEATGASRSLRALGLSEEALPAAAEMLADAAPPGNPGPVRADRCRAAVQRRLGGHGSGIFVRGDAHLDTDAVFGVKGSLIVAFEEQPAGTLPPAGCASTGPWTRAHFDIVLARRPDAHDSPAA